MKKVGLTPMTAWGKQGTRVDDATAANRAPKVCSSASPNLPRATRAKRAAFADTSNRAVRDPRAPIAHPAGNGPQPCPKLFRLPAGGELAGLAQVPFEVVAETIAIIEGVHGGVAARAFGLIGPAALPTRAVHDRVAGTIYGALRAAATGLGRGIAAAAALTVPASTQDLSRTPRGANLVGAVNGIVGDRLAEEGSGAAIRLAVRVDGRDLALDAGTVAAAYPGATGRVVVFLHGLCGSEHSWTPPGGPELSFGARLHADLGYTPVFVRYNSGLHVSANGRALSAVLEELVASWPVEPTELVLIGHSMGGLLARSACHYGSRERADWTELVRHVICLGTPHLGAPLEKVVNAATNGLSLLMETRSLATFLNRRSAGIKDLRFGAVVDEDWLDRDPDAFLQDHTVSVPLLGTARHHALAATVTADRRHPAGRMLGDLLVRLPSATGQGRRRSLPFELDPDHHVGGIHHLRLLHHPAVYDRIRSRLTTA
jgi:pimeloyl-ACP methyl ester carboxylesterase